MNLKARITKILSFTLISLCLIALFPSCNGDPNIINVNNDDKLRLFHISTFDSKGVILPKDTITFRFSEDIELPNNRIINIYGNNSRSSATEDYLTQEYTLISNINYEINKSKPNELLVYKVDGFLPNINKYYDYSGEYEQYLFEIKLSLLDNRSSDFGWNFLVMKPDSTN